MPPSALGWTRYPRSPDGVWHAIEDLRDAVDALRQADQIAEEVTTALVANRRRFFTTWERLLALSISLIVAVSSVVAAVFSIRGH